MTMLPMQELLSLRATLTSIDVAYHSLLSLPEEFFDLQALRVVNLKDNCLLTLPPPSARAARPGAAARWRTSPMVF